MKTTITIIVITIFVFILQSVNIVSGYFAFMPATLLERPFTIITAIFMHSNLHHLMLNMLGLFIFGLIVEKEIGWKNWLLLYVFAGIMGNLGYILLTNSPFIPAVGASGAIFGLMGAAAILKPKQIIWTPYGPIPMIAAAIMWGIGEVISFFGLDNIAQSAHIFGLIGGAVFIYAHKKKISFKVLTALLIIITLITFSVAINVPKEIKSFKPKLDSCFNQVGVGESINFKKNVYACNNNYIISIVQPELTKVDPSYYNNNFPKSTEYWYNLLLKKECSAKLQEINIENDTVYGKGIICDHNFYNLAKNCNNVRVELIQIYENEPEIKFLNCELLS